MALIILDAGVVIGLLDAGDTHHGATRSALAKLRDQGDEMVVPMSAYAEVLVGAYRHGAEAAATLDAFLDALPARVEPIGREIARRAAQLRARHRAVRLPDAFVVATALQLRADSILTTDARWPTVGVSVGVV